MALDFDFWLNGLGFNTAVSKDRPYERATAQFRKDQLDSTATVGDQSLTGWWTRGQLSFHKGAGVKYYEVLGNSDDTIDSRFRDSLGADVWTPGEVTIASTFDRIEQTGILDGAPYSPTATEPVVPVELVSNTGFETNTTGWGSDTLFGFFGAATWARSTARSHSGSASLLATWPTAAGSWVQTSVSTTPGRTYRVTAWVYVPSGSCAIRAHVARNANGVDVFDKDTWVETEVTFIATDTSHLVGIVGINPTSGQTCYIDDFSVQEVAPVGAGVALLQGDGLVRIANTEIGELLSSYTGEGIVSIDSKNGTLYAATPSAIERAGGGTAYQFVKNPAFNNGGDKTWAAAVGGTTSMTWTGSALTYSTTTAGTDGVEFTINTLGAGAARTNLVTNPSFESGTSGWTAGSNTTLTRNTGGSFPAGAYVGTLVSSAAGGVSATSDPIAVTASTDYAIQGWLYSASTSTLALTLRWYDGSSTLLSSDVAAASSIGGSAYRAADVVTAPVGAATVVIAVSGTLPAGGHGVSLDAICLEAASTVQSYFDGDTADTADVAYGWEGVPHASRSLAVASGTVNPVLVRVTVNKTATVQVYNGSTYDSVGDTTASVRKSFFATGNTSGLLKVRIMAKAGATGATSLSEFSVTSSLAETASPNASADTRWSWTGTTNSSIQSRAVAASGLMVLWAPPTGSTWAGAWVVKGRLLAVDNLGRWYDLSPVDGGQVDAGDAFWESSESAGWSVSESPTGVYLSRRNAVYKLTIDDTGLLPTVAAPTVAALLPVNESITSTYCYLGFLILCTSRGVRAALVQSDGSLVYGPRFIEGDFSGCSRIAVDGDNAYVTGIPDEDGNSAVYAVNLATLVDNLSPAYARWLDVEETPFGGTLGPDGVLYFYDSIGLLRKSEDSGTVATLTTGFHRLGTLEPKAFRLLRVKTEGTEGSVGVAVNTPDGTTYTVGTVAAGEVTEFDLSSIGGFPAALEYLSITFTLNRGAATGPTLLGYQLKALPVPKRQRMIRVPLMLMDSEQNRRGQTTHGRRPGVTDPWTRLAALEALEESNAVVSFEDRLTGETGSAYIESVEVSRTANADFGGFIFVTLRIV